MKYICTINDDEMLEIFTFPKSVDHDAMMESLSRMKDHTHGNWKRLIREPISAGFVSDKLVCFGESATLALESRGDEDTELLKSQFMS